MPSEPKSFFERLTGARVLNPSVEDEEQYAPEVTSNRDVPYQPPFASQDEDALEETEVESETFEEDLPTPAAPEEEQEGQLTVDVFQDDENIIIQSTIAGVASEDLDVSITNDMVTIRGERRKQYTTDEEDYFYQECYWGTFSRSIILPVEIDADRAEARIKNGILTIRIPKANTAVTRKLKVKAS
ncbi:MAG: Hsp20/alpha crystallin family protein [Candidatus Andersenbacteria bacterium]|nr:Hsp20/alpha crystallin family protein [Candidatus Andersenbacteria bacterium]MBI3250627.1 Hsp20/alpha crystallin family protein [Candidatus Andersenbacteria bacterium]